MCQVAFFKICGKRDYRDMESMQIRGDTRLTEDLFGDILLRARLLAGMSVGPQFGVLCFDTVTSRTASKHLSQMSLLVKNPPANAGDIRDVGSVPGCERCPGRGHGNPL